MTDSPNAHAPTNAAIARALDRLADCLSERGANAYRVRAYRRAADTVRTHDAPLAALLDDGGPDALEALPAIGENIAERIAGFARTGQLALLRRLHEDASPARLFARVPGIGSALAARVHDALPGLETLEDLENAAHDGRLHRVDGFGRQRIAQVRAGLASLLKGHASRRGARYRGARGARPRHAGGPAPGTAPSVETLLAADRQYRRRAARGDLRCIAPRRFNPEGEAWLPLMKTRQGEWAVTALFSNTARAHRLEKTDDWVVLYTRPAGAPRSQETQHTIVTETRGDLAGQRVVRGREGECRAFYARHEERAAA